MAAALAEPAILVAPDAFKGTLSAAEVAEAVAAGIESAGRAAARCPLADGGEGTLEALTAGADGVEIEYVSVTGPMGRLARARIGLLPDRTAVVEMADAIGLPLVPESERDPEQATTFGAGELIAAAVDRGAQRILIGVGGSATVDGGRGALDALAEAGLVLAGRARPTGCPELIVLADTRAPWEDAPRVFGPQKGASAAAVGRLEAAMARQAERMRKDPRGIDRTGAAGGLAGALWSECGAELVAGAPWVMNELGFNRRLLSSRSLIVGEGRLDASTLLGKAPGEAATRARQAGFGCAAVCGVNGLEPIEERILDLQAVVEAGTPSELQAAGARLAELV